MSPALPSPFGSIAASRHGIRSQHPVKQSPDNNTNTHNANRSLLDTTFFKKRTLHRKNICLKLPGPSCRCHGPWLSPRNRYFLIQGVDQQLCMIWRTTVQSCFADCAQQLSNLVQGLALPLAYRILLWPLRRSYFVVFQNSLFLIPHPGLKSIDFVSSVRNWNEITAQLVGHFWG